MSARLLVCQSANCRDKGSHHTLRDVEELCAGEAEVGTVDCHICKSHCGKGPNVEVYFTGQKAHQTCRVVSGVDSFKKAVHLVKTETGLTIPSLRYKVAALKYEARRLQSVEARLSKVDLAFKALGGTSQALARQPRQAGELLVLQAEILLTKASESDFKLALQKAEAAGPLLPESGLPHLVVAMALERLGRWAEALTALDVAWDIGATCRHATLDRNVCKSLEKCLKDRLALEKVLAEREAECQQLASAQTVGTPTVLQAGPQSAMIKKRDATATAVPSLKDRTKGQRVSPKKKSTAGGKAKVRPGSNSTTADSTNTSEDILEPPAKTNVGNEANSSGIDASSSEAVVHVTASTRSVASLASKNDVEVICTQRCSPDDDQREQAQKFKDAVETSDKLLKGQHTTMHTCPDNSTRSESRVIVEPRTKRAVSIQANSHARFFMCCQPYDDIHEDLENETPIQMLGA